jgi:cobalt-zinc-cadmium efflux system protein
MIGHAEHDHNHDVSNVKGAKLAIVALLNFIITTTELIGGIFSGSLSLISDSLHNFSDGISIIISYIAIRISNKEKDIKRTFGYKRATILAALINSSVLIVISVYLFKEAFNKFINPQEINGSMVIGIALIGLIANIAGVVLLQKGSKGSMNIKSSYLHLLSDALSSVGVVIGGILIYYFKIYWVDPLLTVLIALYVLKESYEIVKDAIRILMQGIPKNLDVEELVKELEKIDAVENVHHVHIWSLDENNINFEAHVNIKDMLVSETDKILKEIEHQLSHYEINHVTIQFEYRGCDGVDIIEK